MFLLRSLNVGFDPQVKGMKVVVVQGDLSAAFLAARSGCEYLYGTIWGERNIYGGRDRVYI